MNIRFERLGWYKLLAFLEFSRYRGEAGTFPIGNMEYSCSEKKNIANAECNTEKE